MADGGKNLGGRPPNPDGQLSFQGIRVDEQDWLTLGEIYGGPGRAQLLRDLLANHLGKEGASAPEPPDAEKVEQARVKARAKMRAKKYAKK